MTKPLFDHRLSVGVTVRMNALLEEMAISRTRNGTPISKSDLIREAIRLYLDQQVDARGSRRQIARSLEGQMENLQTEVHQLNAQLAQQAQFLRHLAAALQPVIDRVTPRPHS